MAFHSYTHLIGKLFNAYPLGPPSRVTGTSAWTCVDHLVSRLPPPTQNALFRLAFTAGAGLSPLASPVTATRRFIMQKARRHLIDRLRPLVGAWFQGLFHSPRRGAFHLSLTVLVHYRSHGSIYRVTQDTTKPHLDSNTGLSPSLTELSRSFFSRSEYYGVVLQPRSCIATAPVWALPRSLATTGGIISLFSLPRGTKMFQFPRFASLPQGSDDRPSDGRVVPFGNLRVRGHLHLTGAYRSLSRPSSPP